MRLLKMCIKRSGLYNYIYKKRMKEKLKRNIGKKCAYIVGTTAHNNLGDHAISIAELKYVKNYFTDYYLFEIEDREVFKYLLPLKEIISCDDIIFLHGGGNVGTEYIDHEIIRRTIIKTFPEQRIVIFPQTFDFRNNRNDRKELNKSAKIYNSHNRLLFMFREKYSYESAIEKIKSDKCILTPDIVLSLTLSNSSVNKDTVFICIRNDVEAITPIILRESIIEECKSKNEKVEIIDTVYKEDFGKEKRQRILSAFWDKLSTAKLVVTDRLHCMVFCHLLNIRCIALPNYNLKVRGTYEWIKDNPNIRFFEDYDGAMEFLRNLDIDSPVSPQRVDLHEYYDYIAGCIKKL